MTAPTKALYVKMERIVKIIRIKSKGVNVKMKDLRKISTSAQERGTLYVPRVPLFINHRSLGEFARRALVGY